MASGVYSCCFSLHLCCLWRISEDAGHTFRAGALPSLPETPAGRAGAQQLAGSSLGCNGQSLVSALPGAGRAQRHLLIPVGHPRKQAFSLPSCFASRRKWVWFPGHKQGSLSQERVINVRKDQGRSTAQLTWQEHKAGRGRDVFWRACKRPKQPNELCSGWARLFTWQPVPSRGHLTSSMGHQQSRHRFFVGKDEAITGLPLLIRCGWKDKAASKEIWACMEVCRMEAGTTSVSAGMLSGWVRTGPFLAVCWALSHHTAWQGLAWQQRWCLAARALEGSQEPRKHCSNGLMNSCSGVLALPGVSS